MLVAVGTMDKLAVRRCVVWLFVSAALTSSLALAQRGAPPATGRGAGPAQTASIEGTVLSDTGTPVANVTVRAIRRVTTTPAGSAIGYTVEATARTTPQGQFQFLSLRPADYVIDIPLTQVTLPASTTSGGRGTAATRLADSFGPLPYLAGATVGAFSFQTMAPFGPAPLPRPPAAGRVTVYPSTILTTSPDAPYGIGNARVVVLREGDTARADLRLFAVEGRRVSGTLTGDPAAIANLGVRLLPVLDDSHLFRDGDFELASTATDARGAFTFLGVPPGRYTLKVLYVPSVLPGAAGRRGAEAPARVGVRGGGAPTADALRLVQWAETAVTVGDTDVAGLSVPLNPAARVTGRIVFNDPALTPADLSVASIGLYSNRPVTIAPPTPVTVAADGTFTALLYGPGRYRAIVSGLQGVGPASFVLGEAAPSPWLKVPDSGRVDDVRVVMGAAPARGVGPAPAVAAPPPPGPDNGFIAGRVIDGLTDEPIANATVSLQLLPGTARRMATTGADGTYSFGEAVAGSYNVLSSAPGYASSGFGKLRAEGPTRTLGLAAREEVRNLIIRMWKPGRVVGRVVDDSGKPIAGLTLTTVHVSGASGVQELIPALVARTDATGSYEFPSLPPARYLVCAQLTPVTMPDEVFQRVRGEMTTGRVGGPFWAQLNQSAAPPPAAASSLIGTLRFHVSSPEQQTGPTPVPIDPSGKLSAYGRTCFAETPLLKDAKPIDVGAGQTVAGIDLKVKAFATARQISGILSGPSGPMPHTALHLMHSGDHPVNPIRGDRFEAASAISDARGRFTFLGVAPGRYTLRVWTGPDGPPSPLTVARAGLRPNSVAFWTEMPVTVGETDVANLSVSLSPTARVSGRLVFAGTGTPPLPSQFAVSLQPREPLNPPVGGDVPRADGSFEVVGYPPGRYGLPVVTVNGWRITSATLNGEPLPGHAIDLTTANVQGLVLTATNQFTTLTGQVQREPDIAPIGANILIFPVNYREWIAQGMTPTRLRRFGPNGSWTYTATWLPPGEYLVLVYRETDGEDLTPAFIERVAPRATRVTLVDGQRVTLNLSVSPIR